MDDVVAVQNEILRLQREVRQAQKERDEWAASQRQWKAHAREMERRLNEALLEVERLRGVESTAEELVELKELPSGTGREDQV